jgi:hypothetical protein
MLSTTRRQHSPWPYESAQLRASEGYIVAYYRDWTQEVHSISKGRRQLSFYGSQVWIQGCCARFGIWLRRMRRITLTVTGSFTCCGLLDSRRPDSRSTLLQQSRAKTSRYQTSGTPCPTTSSTLRRKAACGKSARKRLQSSNKFFQNSLRMEPQSVEWRFEICFKRHR